MYKHARNTLKILGIYSVRIAIIKDLIFLSINYEFRWCSCIIDYTFLHKDTYLDTALLYSFRVIRVTRDI